MAPKKKTKKGPPKDTPKDAPEETEAGAQKRIRGEEYPVLVQGTSRVTFEKLRDQLAEAQQEQRDAAARLPNLVQEHTRRLEAGNQGALTNWRKGAGKEVTRGHRDTQRHKFWQAQRDLEDFLYYQNPIHRRIRQRNDREDEIQKKTKKKKKPMTMDIHGRVRGPPLYNLSVSNKHIEDLLDMYDNKGIGGVTHRNGQTDWDGRPVVREGGDHTLPPVRPNELHLWTPAARLRPIGSMTARNAPNDFNDFNDFKLDEAAITAKWRSIEEREIPETDFPYRTHAERRMQERELYLTHPHNRPSTSTLHIEKTSNGAKTLGQFERMRTEEGIFIAALESSYDWRTSYDCLGPVKSVVHQNFTISEERETIEAPIDDNDDEDASAPPEKSDALKEPVKEASHPSDEVAPKKVTRSQTKSTTASSELPVTTKSTKAKEIKAPPKPLTTIEYPYPAREFESKYFPGRRQIIDDNAHPKLAISATDWCEQTCGRREWHVNMLLSPASSVDSPPHSPIQISNDIENRQLPPTFPDTHLPVIRNVKKQRCPHNPERCRAWWTHSPDECWLVESEELIREENPTLQPLPEVPGARIPALKMFELPESGRKIYEERTIDHYGMSGVGDAKWPRVGVRVPYEPMTFDAFKTPISQSDAVGEDKKVVHEFHALAAPLIPMSPREYHGGEDTESTDRDEGDDEEEDDSDYENDLFYHTYMKFSVGEKNKKKDEEKKGGEGGETTASGGQTAEEDVMVIEEDSTEGDAMELD